MSEFELKTNYNNVLKRLHAYEEFCELNKNTPEEVEPWVQDAKDIINQLADILKIMDQNNIKYKDTQILYGFLL